MYFLITPPPVHVHVHVLSTYPDDTDSPSLTLILSTIPINGDINVFISFSVSYEHNEEPFFTRDPTRTLHDKTFAPVGSDSVTTSSLLPS